MWVCYSSCLSKFFSFNMYIQEPLPDWTAPSQQPFHNPDLQGIRPMISHNGLVVPMEAEQTHPLELQLDDFSQPPFPTLPLANSFSPTAMPVELQARRILGKNEVWNPLWASTPTPQSMLPGSGNYAMCQQSAPSENGYLYQSQGFPESDSAYETQICSASSMYSANMIDTPCYSEGSKSVLSSDSNQVQNQRTADSKAITCGYPNCSWRGKCPSDKKCVSP